MKKTICLAALLLLAAAMGRSGEANVTHLKYTWKAEAGYPELGLPAIDEKIRDWVGNNMSAAAADAFRQDGGAVEDDANPGAAADPGFAESSWEYWLDSSVTHPSPDIVAVTFETHTYAGGAHPAGQKTVLHFNVGDGGEITFDHMFGDPAKALELLGRNAKRLAIETLKQRTPDFPDTGTQAAADPVWFDEGFSPNRENYACLEIAPGGVWVTFQEYQILPYAFGMPRVFFPLDLLAPARPNAKLWP